MKQDKILEQHYKSNDRYLRGINNIIGICINNSMNINFLSFIKIFLFLTVMAILRQYVYLIRSLTTDVSERWSRSNSPLQTFAKKRLQYETKIQTA